MAVVVLFFTVVALQVNYNKNGMHKSSVDEYFTISTIHPKITPEKMTYRALNGPRMFTYLFYPGALVGMINHMGGNIYEDGWKYPGHNYFVRNYQTTSTSIKNNMKDPNLRYFHYYLKFQAIILVFLSFIPVLYLLWKRNLFVAMFMMSTLVGINFLFLKERNFFYIEPLLVSMMSILTWLYLVISEKKRISWFWVLFSAFLFAITISLKFSCLFILVLIGILICSKFKTLEKRIKAVALLIVGFVFFFCLINWDLFYSKEVFNKVVHDYFSNFWQYATGSRGPMVEDYKLHNLKQIIGEIFSSLGGLVFLFPVIIFYGLRWSSKGARVSWGIYTFVILLSVGFIVKQQVYIDRNILPFLPALVLITGVNLDFIVKRLLTKDVFKQKAKPLYLYVLLGLLIFVPIWGSSKNYLKRIAPSAKKNITAVLSSIENPDERRLITIDYNKDLSTKNFKSTKEMPSAPITNKENFKEFIKKNLLEFESTDVVVVTEINNNKQLTNYLLPNIFNTNKQFANHFIFYNTEKENKTYRAYDDFQRNYKKKEVKMLLNDSIAIREDLVLREVKIAKTKTGQRLFLKFDFLTVTTRDWNGCRIYFHGKAYEEDVERLPEDRIRHGYEGWDFSVNQTNTLKYGNTMYVFQDFDPTLEKYKEFSLGIFRGCTTSKEFKVANIVLPE